MMLPELSPQSVAIAKRAIASQRTGAPSVDSRQDIESVVEEAARNIHRASGLKTTLAQAMTSFIKTPEGKALYEMMMRHDTPEDPPQYRDDPEPEAPLKKVWTDREYREYLRQTGQDRETF